MTKYGISELVVGRPSDGNGLRLTSVGFAELSADPVQQKKTDDHFEKMVRSSGYRPSGLIIPRLRFFSW
jgi:hypothetical protein